MPADSRVPVSTETRRKLKTLRDPDQTHDQFIRELIEVYQQYG